MTQETNDAPVPNGLRIREILVERKMVDGELVVVPARDEKGNEIELYSIPVPQEVEHAGAEAIEVYVAEVKAKLNLATPKVVATNAVPDAATVVTATNAVPRASDTLSIADEGVES